MILKASSKNGGFSALTSVMIMGLVLAYSAVLLSQPLFDLNMSAIRLENGMQAAALADDCVIIAATRLEEFSLYAPDNEIVNSPNGICTIISILKQGSRFLITTEAQAGQVTKSFQIMFDPVTAAFSRT